MNISAAGPSNPIPSPLPGSTEPERKHFTAQLSKVEREYVLKLCNEKIVMKPKPNPQWHLPEKFRGMVLPEISFTLQSFYDYLKLYKPKIIGGYITGSTTNYSLTHEKHPQTAIPHNDIDVCFYAGVGPKFKDFRYHIFKLLHSFFFQAVRRQSRPLANQLEEEWLQSFDLAALYGKEANTNTTHKTRYDTFRDFLWNFYLTKETNKPDKFYLITLGSVDIKIYDKIEDYVDVALQDGFHISLDDDRHVLCINNHNKCTERQYRGALKDAEQRIYTISNWQTIRNLLFRVSFKMTQGYYFPLKHEIFPSLIANVLKENHLNQFSGYCNFVRECTNHQLNHYSRSEYGRMVDLINTIGLGIIACKDRKISSAELTHFVKPLIKSWSNPTSNVKYLSRFVNILRDDPSQAANLLKLVRGLYFLKWLKGDPNIEGYRFAFADDKKIRFQFGASLVENQKKATYYLALEESSDPLKLAYDFFEGWTLLSKQLKNPGHLTDLPKDFGFDDLSLKDPISVLENLLGEDNLPRLKNEIEALSKLEEDHPLTSNFKEFCAKLLQLFPEMDFKKKLKLYQIAYESELSLRQANQGSVGLIHQLQKLLHEQPPQLESLATTLQKIPSSEPLLADKNFCHILEQALLSVLRIDSGNSSRQHAYAIIVWAEANRVMTPLNAQSFYIAILEAYKDIAQTKNLKEDLLVFELAQKCLNADKITATRMEHLVHGIADKWLSAAEKQLGQSNGEAVAIIKDILPIILKMEKYRERTVSLFMTLLCKASNSKEIQEAELLLQILCSDEHNHRALQELLETALRDEMVLYITSSNSDKLLLLVNSLCKLPSLQQFKGKIACIKVNDLNALFAISLEILFTANSHKAFEFTQNIHVKTKARNDDKIAQSILSNIQQHAQGEKAAIIADAIELFEFLNNSVSFESIEVKMKQFQLNAYLLEAYAKDPATYKVQAIALIEQILEGIEKIKKGQLNSVLTAQLNDSLLIISRSLFSASQSWGIETAVRLEASLKREYKAEKYRIANVLSYLSLMLNPATKEQAEKNLNVTNSSSLNQDMAACIHSIITHSMKETNSALMSVPLDALCVFLQPHLIAKHKDNMFLFNLINEYLAFIVPHIGSSVQREDAAKCIRLVFTKDVIDALTRHPLLETGVALFHVGFAAGYNVNLLDFCTPLLLQDLLRTFVHKQMQEPASAACMQALHDIFTKFLENGFLDLRDSKTLFRKSLKQSWSTYSKALPDRMAMFLSFLSLMKFHPDTEYKDAAIQYGFTVLQAWQEDHPEHGFISKLLENKSENLYALLNFLRGMFFVLPLKKHPARILQSFKEGSSLLISLHNECATSLVKDFIGSWIMLKKTVQDPKLQKHLSELPQLFGKAFTRLDFTNESDRLHHIKDLIPAINQQSGTLEERIELYEWIGKNGELDFEATAQLNLQLARTQLEQEQRLAAKDSNILKTQLHKEIQSFIDAEPHAFFTHFSNWVHTYQKDTLPASVRKIILCLFKRAYTKILTLDSFQAGYAVIKQAFDLNILSHGEVAEALTLVLQQCSAKINKPEFVILALRILQEIPCTEESSAQFNTIAASLNKHFSNSVLPLAEQLAKTTSSLPQLSDLHVYLKFLHGTALSEAVSAARFMEIIHTLTKQAKASSSFTFKTAVFNTLEEVLFTTSLGIAPALLNDLIDLAEQLLALTSIQDEEYPNASMYREKGELLLSYLCTCFHNSSSQEKDQELKILRLFYIYGLLEILSNPDLPNDPDLSEKLIINTQKLLKFKSIDISNHSHVNLAIENIELSGYKIFTEVILLILLKTHQTLLIELLSKLKTWDALEEVSIPICVALCLNTCYANNEPNETLLKIWNIVLIFNLVTPSKLTPTYAVKTFLHFLITYTEVLKDKCSREIVEKACESIHQMLDKDQKNVINELHIERLLAYSEEAIRSLDALNTLWAKNQSEKLRHRFNSLQPSSSQKNASLYISSFFELDRFPPLDSLENVLDKKQKSWIIEGELLHMQCITAYVSTPAYRTSYDYIDILLVNFRNLTQDCVVIWGNIESLMKEALPKNLANSLLLNKKKFLELINYIITTEELAPITLAAFEMLLNTLSIAKSIHNVSNKNLLSSKEWSIILQHFCTSIVKHKNYSEEISNYMLQIREFLDKEDVNVINKFIDNKIKGTLKTSHSPTIEIIRNNAFQMRIAIILALFNPSLYPIVIKMINDYVLFDGINQKHAVSNEWLNQACDLVDLMTDLNIYDYCYSSATNRLDKIAILKEYIKVLNTIVELYLKFPPDNFYDIFPKRLSTSVGTFKKLNEIQMNDTSYYDDLLVKTLENCMLIKTNEKQAIGFAIKLRKVVESLSEEFLLLKTADYIRINQTQSQNTEYHLFLEKIYIEVIAGLIEAKQLHINVKDKISKETVKYLDLLHHIIYRIFEINHNSAIKKYSLFYPLEKLRACIHKADLVTIMEYAIQKAHKIKIHSPEINAVVKNHDPKNQRFLCTKKFKNNKQLQSEHNFREFITYLKSEKYMRPSELDKIFENANNIESLEENNIKNDTTMVIGQTKGSYS